jgi:serine/threonine protein kinase
VTDSSTPAQPAPDPLVGELLAGRYRILSKIGEGAMGAVYLGEHVRMGRRDAIKVLRNDVHSDAESMSRFVRGARNVSLIRHPNVCTIYDFSDTAEGRQFLAMEFIEGDTLKEVLDRDGRLGLDRALRIIEQVADALQAAHEVGVIHRDLKPANVMITRRSDGAEVVKVVDFDIAKGPDEAHGEEVTRLGFVVGTPEYMSPEQLMGERLDGRSDLYSLAVMFFRMLTGALPFRATATQDMMIERLTATPVRLDELLPEVPAGVADAIAQALSRRREDRQEGTGAFARELHAALHTGAGTGQRPRAAASPSAGSTVAAGSATAVSARGAEMPLPATRVAPAQNMTPGPAAPPPASRRGVLVAAVVAVIVVVGAGAIALTNGSGGDGEAVPEARPEQLYSGTGSETGPEENPSNDVAQGTGGDARTSDPAASPAGGAQAGGPAGTAVASPRTTPVTPPPGMPAGSIQALLERQMELLSESPDARTLRAVNDTAMLAWSSAALRADSAAAAMTLAQVAILRADDAACRRWAGLAARLGVSAANRLLQACG